MTSSLSSSFSAALDAAQAAAGAQQHPPGVLYVVATPIGNLADITLRALHLLAVADVVACEDTRHTQSMLRAYGIERPTAELVAVHEHNEAEAAQAVMERLRQGQRVVYVSDAGTPAISDPGARLVHAAREAGLRVMPLPGASSITTALSAAGLIDDGRFVFEGFLPTRSQERASAVQSLVGQPRAVVLLESPHRIAALAQALAALGGRRVTVARELTKQYEQVHTLSCEGLAGWLAEDAHRQRGEFVLVIHPASPSSHEDTRGREAVQLLLAEGLPVKSAARLAATLTGAPRNALYELALALKREGATDADADEAG